MWMLRFTLHYVVWQMHHGLLVLSKDVMLDSVFVRYPLQCESVRRHVGLQRLFSGGDSPLVLLPQEALVRSPDTELLRQLHAAGGALSAASQQYSPGLGSTFFLSDVILKIQWSDCVHNNMTQLFFAAACYSEKTMIERHH